MTRRKKTPAGGTAGVGAAGQVAATNASAPQYSTPVKPRQSGLPLDLSRQLDCATYLEESIRDPLTKRFAAILLRRLQENIPAEIRQ